MPRSSPFLLALLTTVVALAGCAQNGEFPSLMPRPQEQGFSLVEPRRAPVEVPGDAELRQRVAELRGQAARGETEFDAAYGAADRATARAGAPESESWIEAQQALSRLEAARGAVTEALAGLDRLATARADLPTSDEDEAAINDAFVAVRLVAERQQARLTRLRDRLSR